MSQHSRLIFTLLVLWLTAFAARANDATLEVIQLHHRPAAEVIPIIEPFLGKDDVIHGNGFQLIIRTTPVRLTQIRKLLEQIDTAPRRLLITVRQVSQSRSQEEHAGAAIETTPDRTQVDARIYSTDSRDDGAAIQQIQVLEGKRAFIQTGQSVPVGERGVTITGGGAYVQDTVRYKDVTSGFYVRPRINRDRVILHIIPQKSTLSRDAGGKINLQQADTTVSGRLGEWIPIGGTMKDAEEQGQGIIYRTRNRSERQGYIEVKVEELKH